jgi:60 kDa SS-A/Ro ribonucleoprotein
MQWITWLMWRTFKADVICFWTDCESWAGRRHPSQALAEYRAKMNRNVKAVYVTLVPNQITLADPQDPQSWDIAGFDPGAPRLLQMLATDAL